MKIITLTLLLSSCSTFSSNLNKRDYTNYYARQIEDCMYRFVQQGFNAKDVINMCSAVFKKR